jgi:hypothetical protein
MSRFRFKPSDEGSALLIAVMIGVTVAQSSSRSSGVDRQRLLAVNAAEAGIDSGYVAIQQGSLTPPCGLSSPNIKSGPDVAAYSTTITYYDAAGATLSCPSGGVVSGIPAKALIKSTATTNTLGGGGTRGRRVMEALVNINPVNDVSLNKAIFANGNLSINNKTTVAGNNGPDADIYTNADFACANNENFAGSIYSQGIITLGNSCTAAGNIWAGKSITNASAWNGSVAGFAKAGGGAITLNQGPGTITGNLYGSSTITYGGCGSPGKCFPNGSPGAPPFQPFPIIKGDQATLDKWAAGGNGLAAYNVVPWPSTPASNCTPANIEAKVIALAQVGTSQLLSTACKVVLSSSFSVKNDLAIFTSGGLTTGKLTISSSVVGTKHNLHFIVPYDAAPSHPCGGTATAPDIQMDTDKQFDFTDDIDLFVYSPCDINYRNSSNHIGQIYGGSSVSIYNQFNMQFKPVPVLGVDPTSLPTLSYIPSIVYKRETV